MENVFLKNFVRFLLFGLKELDNCVNVSLKYVVSGVTKVVFWWINAF